MFRESNILTTEHFEWWVFENSELYIIYSLYTIETDWRLASWSTEEYEELSKLSCIKNYAP